MTFGWFVLMQVAISKAGDRIYLEVFIPYIFAFATHDVVELDDRAATKQNA